ncbi:hypothetical protein F5Y13DRAFT_186134 [Hypoxylon sp. FL1857]|nr:hypothetical protein F5Y13DRAFT_186134 [Hypoxylon sp. FL1857]
MPNRPCTIWLVGIKILVSEWIYIASKNVALTGMFSISNLDPAVSTRSTI